MGGGGISVEDMRGVRSVEDMRDGARSVEDMKGGA